MKRTSGKSAGKKGRKTDLWDLRLYVAGNTAKSSAALRNLRTICEEKLCGQYKIEVIDLLKHPEQAGKDQILAIPTLVRRLPAPVRKLVGDLSEHERVLLRLDLLFEGAEHVVTH